MRFIFVSVSRFASSLPLCDLAKFTSSGLALDFAAQSGLTAKGERTACELLQAASSAGFRAEYWPVVAKVIENKA
jgi:hypothetical protein